MCDPVTLTVTAMALTATAGGYQAYSQVQEGKAQRSYYNYLAAGNEVEAQLAERQGNTNDTIAQNEGAMKSKEVARQIAGAKGTQTAAIAANMGAGSTTAEDILGDTFDKGQLDQQMVRYNADMKSYEAQTTAKMSAWGSREQAKTNTWQGKVAAAAGKKAAIGTLITTAASVASMGAGLGGGGMTVKGAGTAPSNTAPFKLPPRF
jgi:hypothetical protein